MSRLLNRLWSLLFKGGGSRRREHASHNVVVAAFIHKEDSVLIAKRASEKRIAPGKYHLPGGHVNFAESAAAALEREIREELGVDIIVDDPFYVFGYSGPEGTDTVGIVFFATLRDESQPFQMDREELIHWKWVSQADVDAVFGAPRDHNYAAIKAGFERLLKTKNPAAPELQTSRQTEKQF